MTVNETIDQPEPPLTDVEITPSEHINPIEYEYIYDESESNLVRHAKRELELLGYFNDSPGDDLGEDMNLMMAEDVLELITVFSKQGHSGFSAPYCVNLFSELAKFKVLSPLTGLDDEWTYISEQNEAPLYQNKRNGAVFKEGDRAYHIDGIVWEDRDGCTYTNRDSRVWIESFPYTPKTEYRKDYEDGVENNQTE